MFCIQRNVNSTLNFKFSHQLLSPGCFKYCSYVKKFLTQSFRTSWKRSKKTINWFLSEVNEFVVQNRNINLRKIYVYNLRVHHCSVFLQPHARVWLTVLSPGISTMKFNFYWLWHICISARTILMLRDKYTRSGYGIIWGPLLCCR
jgi:hypothetical protein